LKLVFAMPQFMIVGRDGAEGLERRKTHRPAHLAYWGAVHAERRMVYAGPLLDDAGTQPIGSLLVFEAATLEAARETMQGDPYVTGGVFGATELHPVKQVLPEA
jgi:uncharacterized protein YciI